jgi:peptidoglycan/xylan/chitin deacetylase (PgdA/CDA1 family)
MFHDGLDSQDGADRGATVEATEKVILALQEKSYRFLTVDELLACAQ